MLFSSLVFYSVIFLVFSKANNGHSSSRYSILLLILVFLNVLFNSPLIALSHFVNITDFYINPDTLDIILIGIYYALNGIAMTLLLLTYCCTKDNKGIETNRKVGSNSRFQNKEETNKPSQRSATLDVQDDNTRMERIESTPIGSPVDSSSDSSPCSYDITLPEQTTINLPNQEQRHLTLKAMINQENVVEVNPQSSEDRSTSLDLDSDEKSTQSYVKSQTCSDWDSESKVSSFRTHESLDGLELNNELTDSEIDLAIETIPLPPNQEEMCIEANQDEWPDVLPEPYVDIEPEHLKPVSSFDKPMNTLEEDNGLELGSNQQVSLSYVTNTSALMSEDNPDFQVQPQLRSNVDTESSPDVLEDISSEESRESDSIPELQFLPKPVHQPLPTAHESEANVILFSDPNQYCQVSRL